VRAPEGSGSEGSGRGARKEGGDVSKASSFASLPGRFSRR
jgi:hypothetical protein